MKSGCYSHVVLLFILLTATSTISQDILLPGTIPAAYSDGYFSTPSSVDQFFDEGQLLYVKWNSSYSNVNVFLITGFDDTQSQPLASELNCRRPRLPEH